MAQENILVTGVPRSGTTVIGRMIAFSRDVNYVWEPFNLKYRKGVPDYYPYIGNETRKKKRDLYDSLITDTIHMRNLKPIIEINPQDSIIKRVGKKLGINRTTFLWYKWPQIKNKLHNHRVLLCKDPIGIFLSGHLVKKYDFKIIVAMRHPAAIASSRRKLGWRFDFDWWRNQSDLYVGHFKELDDTLKNYDMDFITETSFHWLTCYSYIKRIKEFYPGSVMVVRHEDLCQNPVGELEKVFGSLGLRFDDKIISKITGLTTGDRLAKLEKRDAKKLIYKWKHEINEIELDRIKEITKSISSSYYDKNEFWQV